MTTISTTIQVMGEVSAERRQDLQNTLLHAYSNFSTYARLFDSRGISRDDILTGDSLKLLRMLPIMEGDTLHKLSEEGLRNGSRIVDMETSSGSTGPRKRRFISYKDDISETELLAELFKTSGIDESDTVACIDTDPLTLMASFTRALDLLGVGEAYIYCVGPDFDKALESLPALNPSVIITIPSIIERCFASLERHYGKADPAHLRKVIYVGETLSASTRGRLESAFGVEVFGYYGASETSALGIECHAHDGIHLFTNRNIIELIIDDPQGLTGEIVVTTLNQETMPLLRYALKDVVRVNPGPCTCGLEYPRVEVKGKAGDYFSVLGAKISYNPIVDAVYEHPEDARLMQLILTREAAEKLTIVLPNACEHRETDIRKSLLKGHPDLDFLVGSNYLHMQFAFVEADYFEASRKPKRIVDHRRLCETPE